MKKSRTSLLIILVMISGVLFAQEKSVKLEELHPALLVIDVQNEYLPMMSEPDRAQAMENINTLIKLFRKKDLPVIGIYHHSEKDGPHPGSKAFEFPESVLMEQDDPIVVKHYGDAFNKTKLDKILKKLDRNTVILCGLSATGCVLATQTGGFNHDYYSFLVKDAMLSQNLDYTNHIEEILNALEMETVKKLVDAQ